ncbi:hypothetical protein VTH82DRAFT_4169 [Thermothelomyces myriococcoides]
MRETRLIEDLNTVNSMTPECVFKRFSELMRLPCYAAGHISCKSRGSDVNLLQLPTLSSTSTYFAIWAEAVKPPPHYFVIEDL